MLNGRYFGYAELNYIIEINFTFTIYNMPTGKFWIMLLAQMTFLLHCLVHRLWK